MDKTMIYTGEDFSVRFRAFDDTGEIKQDLSPFDVVVLFSNSTMCRNITASTMDGSDVEIAFSDDYSYFTIEVGHLLTSQLCTGDMTVSVMLINKQSGARIIAESRAIRVEESRIGRITI